MPRRPEGGYLVETGPGGIVESSSFTCGHCQKIKRVRPKENPDDLGGLCRMCNRLICPDCVDKGCDPFEKKLERAEASYHARRSYGLTS